MNRHRYDAVILEHVVQHLGPQGERHNEGLALMADPVSQLIEIDAALSDWPADAEFRVELSAVRRESMAAGAVQAAQLRRTLAAVGAAPQQLAQLGGDALDNFLQLELTLVAQEAAWQLRSLARQTTRRWNREPDGQHPDALQAWLDRVEALLANVNSITPAHADDTE
ncbi:hypothetical protein [Rhodoferax sp. UBA5149]|uniref:hypothetical protein n=1 Tax=Rhodoferax sp. UBA5149 TaxID=1947379 RepID=UPI0025CE1D58|nr:hypothetical protein [Rhodoferax sp. UBA5149]